MPRIRVSAWTLFLAACTASSPETLPGPEPTAIVIIAEDAPRPWRHFLGDSTGPYVPMRARLDWIDADGLERAHVFAEDRDTLHLELEAPWVEVRHPWRPGWDRYAYLRPGDTLWLSYRANEPLMRRTSAEYGDTVLAAERLRRAVHGTAIPEDVRCLFPMAYGPQPAPGESPQGFHRRLSEHAEACVEDARRSLERERAWLTAHSGDLPDHARGPLERDLAAREGLLALGALPAAPGGAVLGFPAKGALDAPLHPVPDALMAPESGRQQHAMLWARRWSMDRLAAEIPLRPVAQGMAPDHAARFRWLAKTAELPDWAVRLLLRDAVDGLLAEAPLDSARRYLERLLVRGDTAFVADRRALYERDLQGSEALELLLPDGRRSTWEAQRDAWAGQVIYLDLWASWCGPCRTAMPESRRLRERFRGEPVVFAFLAFNDREPAWREAMQEDGLDSVDAWHALILNPRAAALTGEWNVRTLPRYLLFGPDGALVDDRAPGPGPEAEAAIRRLLK